MPTTTLQPGAVVLDGPFEFDPHTQSAVVGDPPQWADASDATYARVNRRFHDTEPYSGSDFAAAPLAVFAPSGTVTAVDVTIRCSSSTGGTTDVLCFLYSTAIGRYSGPVAALAERPVITADGSIQTVTGTFPDDDEDPENNNLALATLVLAAGATVETLVASPFGGNLTIYEVTVTVTTTTDEVLVTRLFPRKDAHGPMGSAPRLIGNIPPERIVGGHM